MKALDSYFTSKIIFLFLIENLSHPVLLKSAFWSSRGFSWLVWGSAAPTDCSLTLFTPTMFVHRQWRNEQCEKAFESVCFNLSTINAQTCKFWAHDTGLSFPIRPSTSPSSLQPRRICWLFFSLLLCSWQWKIPAVPVNLTMLKLVDLHRYNIFQCQSTVLSKECRFSLFPFLLLQYFWKLTETLSNGFKAKRYNLFGM